MIQAHISFHEPYSYEKLMYYVKQAQEQGMEELTIVEPTHKFLECSLLYKEVTCTYPCQQAWYEAIPKISIIEYQQFITQMRTKTFPINVKFGLNVCYFTQHEQFLKHFKKAFHYDCFIGSIQFLDNLAFSWEGYSKEMLWDKYNASFIYRRYYEMMNALITSRLFDGVDGFDDIMTMHVKPGFKMHHTYHKLGMLLALHHMYVMDEIKNGEEHRLCEPFKDMCKELHVEIYIYEILNKFI